MGNLEQTILSVGIKDNENIVTEVAVIAAATADTTITEPLPQVQQPLDQNPAAIYLATLRPNGRRAMRYALDTMAHYIATGSWPADKGRAKSGKSKNTSNNSSSYVNKDSSGNGSDAGNSSIPDALSLPWHTLRYQHTSALMAALREHYKPATANLMLSALRGVLSQAENLGLMTAEEYRRAVKIKSVKNHTLPKGRSLAGDELAALLKVCAGDESPTGVRDAAMIAVLYNAGLRRSEVIKLDVKDYNANESSLTVRGGKGGKDRVTYLADEAVAALNEWLVVRQEGLDALTLAKGVTTDKFASLFCPISKADRVQPRRMTDQAVLYILQKRGKEAGLEQSFSPHDFRRTFISDLLDAGADIATVQKLAGHANVTTTARYDRRGEDTKRKAAQLLKLPYGGSKDK